MGYFGKSEILKRYKASDLLNPKAILLREKLFNQLQQANEIPRDEKFSDETYYEHIGKHFDDMTLEEAFSQNSFLTKIFNKLAWVDFRLMNDKDDELFSDGLQPPKLSGTTIEVVYDQIAETEGYELNSFSPDKVTGGEYVYAQRYKLCPIMGKDAPDKRTKTFAIPIAEIQGALQPAISSGLPEGFPAIFLNILKRTWEKNNFERARKLISMAGGEPSGNKDASGASWFDPSTTWTKNENQFIKIEKPITDEQSAIAFLKQIYNKASELGSEYKSQYNPAGIQQRNRMSDLSLDFDYSFFKDWIATSATIFNSKIIDPKQKFKKVRNYAILPSIVDPKIKKIKAILYSDLSGKHPFMHTPMASEGSGLRRYTQFWAKNEVGQISEHYWMNSAIDLSKNMLIFYEEEASESEEKTSEISEEKKENHQTKNKKNSKKK